MEAAVVISSATTAGTSGVARPPHVVPELEERYRIGRLLGQGSQGDVWTVTRKTAGATFGGRSNCFAVKFISFDDR